MLTENKMIKAYEMYGRKRYLYECTICGAVIEQLRKPNPNVLVKCAVCKSVIERGKALAREEEKKKQIKIEAVKEFVEAYIGEYKHDCTFCDREVDDYCCIKCFRDRWIEKEQK